MKKKIQLAEARNYIINNLLWLDNSMNALYFLWAFLMDSK